MSLIRIQYWTRVGLDSPYALLSMRMMMTIIVNTKSCRQDTGSWHRLLLHKVLADQQTNTPFCDGGACFWRLPSNIRHSCMQIVAFKVCCDQGYPEIVHEIQLAQILVHDFQAGTLFQKIYQ